MNAELLYPSQKAVENRVPGTQRPASEIGSGFKKKILGLFEIMEDTYWTYWTDRRYDIQEKKW